MNAESSRLQISVTKNLIINMAKPLGRFLMVYHLLKLQQCKFLVVLMEISRLTINYAKEALSGSASQVMIKDSIAKIPFHLKLMDFLSGNCFQDFQLLFKNKKKQKNS